MPSLQSATMIGHGRKDPRPQLNEKYRQDCLMITARTNCHQHVKKDLQMLTKYPETIQKLEALGDTKNEVRRTEVEIQVKQAYTFSNKLYQYYKWYSSKSPTILSKKECVRPESVYPSPPLPLSGDFSTSSKHRTFRTNIIFPNPML